MGAVKSWSPFFCFLSYILNAVLVWMRFEIGTLAAICSRPVLPPSIRAHLTWNTCCCLRMFMLRLKPVVEKNPST